MRYFLICTFLFVTYLTKGDNPGSLFKVADSLMQIGHYQDARIELEKIVFFSHDQQKTTQALIKKAECFKQEKHFSQANTTLNRIFLPLQPDSLLFKIKYNKAINFYLNEEPGRAISELQSITKLTEEEEAIRIKFLSALCYSELKEWQKSKEQAADFISLTYDNQEQKEAALKKLDELFSAKNIPQELSPQKAKNISTFVPGGGQFYSGKIGEGILSIGLEGALLYFGVSQFINKFYFTGYTAGFGLLQRIYTGNLQRSQDLAKQVNQHRYDKFFIEYFEFLTTISK